MITTDKKCVIIIFSRDRALQLDATIRSLILHCQDVEEAEIRVLYTTTTPCHTLQYENLKIELSPFNFLRFIAEDNFRCDLLSLLAPHEFVFFLVDDNIFIRKFSLKSAIGALTCNTDALGFSFRLGKNTRYCYSLDTPQNLPEFSEATSGVLKFDWTAGGQDFGYPLEVSSSLFRLTDIYEFISTLPFRNPNTFEAVIAAHKTVFSEEQRYLLCYEHSITFCAPVNKVQAEIVDNRSGENTTYTAENLASLYEGGSRLDITFYSGFMPTSCHQEVELRLNKNGNIQVQPLVSVVIPCYNQGNFLPEAVESVVSQTYTNWECIIVNDGSPDNTSCVAHELIGRYPGRNIRLLEKENGGLPSARNAGIRNSNGIFWLPLDADDKLAPSFMEKTVTILNEHSSIGFVYSHIQHFGESNDLYPLPEFDADTIIHRDNTGCVCSLVRRSVWEEIGGYNADMSEGYEDWDFWISSIEKGWKGYRIPEALFQYRKRSTSMLSNSNRKREKLIARIVLNHPDLYSERVIQHAQLTLEEEASTTTVPRVLIALTHFWPSVGGLETIAENLGNRLVKKGYQIEVATWKHQDRTSSLYRGMKIISLDTFNTSGTLPDWVAQLRQLITSGIYNTCILLADPQNLVIWSTENAKIHPRTRLIIQPLINEDGFANWKDNAQFRARLTAILKKAHAVVALSLDGADTRYFREDGIPSVYVPNAAEHGAQRSDFRASYDIPKNASIILHVANLWPVKNHDGILKTLRGMPGDWRLVMVGHPSGDTTYVKKIHLEASLDHRVILIPGLPREEVDSAMAAADVVILASHGEVSPVTIMEAMSHGKPWVATPACGAVRDFAGGIVVPLCDFPNVLQKLLKKASLRAALGDAGLQHWQTCFTWDAVAEGWNELISTGSLRRSFAMPPRLTETMKKLTGETVMTSQSKKTTHPLVSVIVPTFNRPDMLVGTLKSIINQTLQDFEIIVVNDAGVDVEGLVNHLNDDGRITYVRHAANKGLAAARNTGIKLALGKYIAYLDDDDLFYPNHLETLVTFLENSDFKVAYTDAYRARQVKECERYAVVDRDVPYSFDFDCDAILVNNFVPVLCFIHEKSCLVDVGMFDERLTTHEDWDLWIRLSQGFSFAHIKNVTCEFSWRSDGTSMTSSSTEDFLKTTRIIYSKHRDLALHKPHVLEAQRRALEARETEVRKLTQREIPAEQLPTPATQSTLRDVALVDSLLEKADTLANAGRYDEALAKYQLVLNNFSNNSRAMVGIGVVKFLAGKCNEAADAFTEALRIDPSNSKALCGLGMARYGQGFKNAACQYFEKALDVDPENITALNELIKIAYDCGNFDKAVTCTRSYLMYHPADLDMLFSFAGILYKSGSYEEAQDVLEQLLAFSPEYGGGKELLGKILTISVEKTPSKAKADTNSLYADSAETFIEQAGDRKAEGKYEEALKLFVKAREFGEATVLADMGDCKANLGDFHEAVKLYEEALLHNPEDIRPPLGLGVVNLVQGNQTKAFTWFNKALKCDPANTRALCGLGMVRNLQNKPKEALKYCSLALDSDPENLNALHEVVKCSYELNRFDEAEKYLRDYLMYHPGDLDMQFSLAGVLFKKENYSSALEHVENLLIFEPEYAGGMELKEKVYTQLGTVN